MHPHSSPPGAHPPHASPAMARDAPHPSRRRGLTRSPWMGRLLPFLPFPPSSPFPFPFPCLCLCSPGGRRRGGEGEEEGGGERGASFSGSFPRRLRRRFGVPPGPSLLSIASSSARLRARVCTTPPPSPSPFPFPFPFPLPSLGTLARTALKSASSCSLVHGLLGEFPLSPSPSPFLLLLLGRRLVLGDLTRPTRGREAGRRRGGVGEGTDVAAQCAIHCAHSSLCKHARARSWTACRMAGPPTCLMATSHRLRHDLPVRRSALPTDDQSTVFASVHAPRRPPPPTTTTAFPFPTPLPSPLPSSPSLGGRGRLCVCGLPASLTRRRRVAVLCSSHGP